MTEPRPPPVDASFPPSSHTPVQGRWTLIQSLRQAAERQLVDIAAEVGEDSRLLLRCREVWGNWEREALISVVLSVAYYLTLAKFLWFLLLPWLLYALVWLGTVMTAYGLGPVQSGVLALGLVFLGWLVEWLLGVKTFRSE